VLTVQAPRLNAHGAAKARSLFPVLVLHCHQGTGDFAWMTGRIHQW